MLDGIYKYKSELINAGKFLDQRGLVPATSGNLSLRLGSDEIAITASGCHKGRMSENDILLIDGHGRCNDGRKPSAEMLLHLQIYNRFKGVRAVIHPHSIAATLLSRVSEKAIEINGYELLKAFSDIDTHEAKLTVPIFENDQNIARLADSVNRWMNQHSDTIYGYLIAGHGFYTWGRAMDDALRHVEALEFLFDCELRTRGVHKK